MWVLLMALSQVRSGEHRVFCRNRLNDADRRRDSQSGEVVMLPGCGQKELRIALPPITVAAILAVALAVEQRCEGAVGIYRRSPRRPLLPVLAIRGSSSR